MVRRRSAFTAFVLAGVASGGLPVAAQQRVPLALNHLEILLDSATLGDIRTSPFLREQFAAIDTMHESRGGGVRGVQFFGKYDWMTLSIPAPAHGDRVGDVVIVLSSDAPHAIETLTRDGPLKRFSTAPGATDVGPMTRDYLRDFHSVARLAGPDSTSSRAAFAIMQYDENISRLLAQADSLPITNLSNARFLARYYDRHKLLEYLSGATLAIPVDDIARIAQVLERDSMTVLHEGEGAIIKLDGFTLHLIPPWTGAGVKQLQFALTRDVPANPVYRFGPHSQLRFGPGPIAVWDFNAR